jgi:Holliday junction resolvasome RuvABC DNA-binding subunit
MNSTVKLRKLYYKNESQALQEAINKLGVDASLITTQHNSTHYVFKTDSNNTINVQEEETLETGVDTYVVEDTKTFYSFKKVRQQ